MTHLQQTITEQEEKFEENIEDARVGAPWTQDGKLMVKRLEDIKSSLSTYRTAIIRACVKDFGEMKKDTLSIKIYPKMKENDLKKFGYNQAIEDVTSFLSSYEDNSLKK